MSERFGGFWAEVGQAAARTVSGGRLGSVPRLWNGCKQTSGHLVGCLMEPTTLRKTRSVPVIWCIGHTPETKLQRSLGGICFRHWVSVGQNQWFIGRVFLGFGPMLSLCPWVPSKQTKQGVAPKKRQTHFTPCALRGKGSRSGAFAPGAKRLYAPSLVTSSSSPLLGIGS